MRLEIKSKTAKAVALTDTPLANLAMFKIHQQNVNARINRMQMHGPANTLNKTKEMTEFLQRRENDIRPQALIFRPSLNVNACSLIMKCTWTTLIFNGPQRRPELLLLWKWKCVSLWLSVWPCAAKRTATAYRHYRFISQLCVQSTNEISQLSPRRRNHIKYLHNPHLHRPRPRWKRG